MSVLMGEAGLTCGKNDSDNKKIGVIIIVTIAAEKTNSITSKGIKNIIIISA